MHLVLTSLLRCVLLLQKLIKVLSKSDNLYTAPENKKMSDLVTVSVK